MLAGAWYPVSRIDHGAVVILAVNGRRFETAFDLLEFDDRKRDWAVHGIQLDPDPSVVVVCPAGHHAPLVSPIVSAYNCNRCRKRYEIRPEPVESGKGTLPASILKSWARKRRRDRKEPAL